MDDGLKEHQRRMVPVWPIVEELSAIKLPPQNDRQLWLVTWQAEAANIIEPALRRCVEEQREKDAGVADKEDEYWQQSDSYAEHPSARSHTASTISAAIRKGE